MFYKYLYNFQPDKVTTDEENEENTGEYLNEEYDEDDDDEDIDEDNINLQDNKEENAEGNNTNLKRFTKNHEFIKTIISSYQKQKLLWDSSYRTLKSKSPEKQKALEIILKEINEKFKICATLPQIERVIKRLKLRYIHQLRLRDKGESYKPVWFYDLLTFLEPHFKDNKVVSDICEYLLEFRF